MRQTEQFDRIYAETRDDLLRYLTLRTNADPEAEDLFQEVYRRFYDRLTRGVPVLDPRRYLFSVAKEILFVPYDVLQSLRTITFIPVIRSIERLDLVAEKDGHHVSIGTLDPVFGETVWSPLGVSAWNTKSETIEFPQYSITLNVQ